MFLTALLVSGYSVCGLYPTEDPNSTVFDPRLMNWITTFYAITVVQGGLTTGLMGFRIWQADQKTASIRTGRSNLMPVLRILIESASIQFMAEVILLSLYSANYNAQYLVLESVTPLVVSVYPVRVTESVANIRLLGHHFQCHHHPYRSVPE